MSAFSTGPPLLRATLHLTPRLSVHVLISLLIVDMVTVLLRDHRAASNEALLKIIIIIIVLHMRLR